MMLSPRQFGTYSQELNAWDKADKAAAEIQARPTPPRREAEAKGPYYQSNQAMRSQRGG
jgi:hypothetical protein